MRRVISVWLPSWATDFCRRRGQPGAAPRERLGEAPRGEGEALVTSRHDGHRRVVAGADAAARALGLYSGMPLAQAQAMIPGLAYVEADPEGEAQALAAAACWCLRYAPMTAPDAPDGIWIDATGCAHLFGGEPAMLADLVAHFSRAGIAARAAIADTPGAAWAVARHGEAVLSVVPSGETAAVLAPLPVAALRLPDGLPAGVAPAGAGADRAAMRA